MAIELNIRKFGSSLGIIFPKEFVKERKLHVNEKVMIEVFREANLHDMFGSLKGKTRMPGQEFKDMVRKGWR